MPALGLTDHGVMNGAVEHYKACKATTASSRSSASRPTWSTTAAPRARASATTSPCSRRPTRAFATSSSSRRGGFLEGFRRGKPTVDAELLDRHSAGVIALTGCLQSRFCQRLVSERPARRPRATSTTWSASTAPRTSTSRSRRTASPEQDKANEGIVRIAKRARPARLSPPADVHYLRREDYTHHAALLCVQTKSTDREPEADASTPTSSSSRARRRWRSRSRQWPEAVADHARDRRALQRRHGARPACSCRASRRPTARSPARCSGASPPRASAPLRRSAARRGDRAPRVRARRDRRDGLRLLLPHRLGLRQASRRTTGSRSARAAARRQARSSPTPSTSPTSTRSPTTCCSSAS